MGHVIHVTAVWRRGPDLVTIAINEHSPASPTDSAILDAARARADVIVTTGRNVRMEPDLCHAPSADRLARLGKSAAPRTVILSRSGVDPEHPIFRSGDVQIVAPEGGLRAVVTRLRDDGETVLVEAGPTTVGALYEAPGLVDELQLSIFEGHLDARAVGPTLAREADLRAVFSGPAAQRCLEPSGAWTFETLRPHQPPS